MGRGDVRVAQRQKGRHTGATRWCFSRQLTLSFPGFMQRDMRGSTATVWGNLRGLCTWNFWLIVVFDWGVKLGLITNSRINNQMGNFFPAHQCTLFAHYFLCQFLILNPLIFFPSSNSPLPPLLSIATSIHNLFNVISKPTFVTPSLLSLLSSIATCLQYPGLWHLAMTD